MRLLLDIGDSAADVPAVLRSMDGNGLTLVGVDRAHVGCRVLGLMADDGSVRDLNGSPVRLDIREWYLPEMSEVPPGFGPDTHYHRHPKGSFTGHEHEGGRVLHRHDDPEHAHRGPAVPL